MIGSIRHRLDGLEPDNPLAFLALLGLLRALEHHDLTVDPADRLLPRASWDIANPPLRPALVLAREVSREEVAEAVARGIDGLAIVHEFDGEKNLNFSAERCRELLKAAARGAGLCSRERVDLLAALMTDGAIKDQKGDPIQATPFCLQFGQGHQHFLERLTRVPREEAPPPRGRGQARKVTTAVECLIDALFHPWDRTDPTDSFRWDPAEDVRWALMAGDPTDPAYKAGTQHGANRLAAVGLSVLTVVPQRQFGRTRAAVMGGAFTPQFSFAWPVWKEPASLATIRAMLSHPALRKIGGLAHLSVAHVFVAQRISSGKFMSFTRGRPVESDEGNTSVNRVRRRRTEDTI